MSRVVRLDRHAPIPTLATAIAAFLAEHALSPTSHRVYAGALRALQDGLGADTLLANLDERQLMAWFRERYGRTAPATRVRQRAILRSACTFWRQRAWLTTNPTARLERPKVSPDRTRALTRDQLTALWRRDDVALRERAFWRLLYESAARASEILSLDVADLDLPNKRARVRSKGGATEWVFWQTGAALLLPRLLAGRPAGPVFLADRQPTRPVPGGDRCPLTGRARLSYRRAAELFSDATEHRRCWRPVSFRFLGLCPESLNTYDTIRSKLHPRAATARADARPLGVVRLALVGACPWPFGGQLNTNAGGGHCGDQGRPLAGEMLAEAAAGVGVSREADVYPYRPLCRRRRMPRSAV